LTNHEAGGTAPGTMIARTRRTEPSLRWAATGLFESREGATSRCRPSGRPTSPGIGVQPAPFRDGSVPQSVFGVHVCGCAVGTGRAQPRRHLESVGCTQFAPGARVCRWPLRLMIEREPADPPREGQRKMYSSPQKRMRPPLARSSATTFAEERIEATVGASSLTRSQ